MSSIARRELLLAGLGVLVGGCAEQSFPEDDEPAALTDQFDCTSPTRPQPDVEADVEVTTEGDDGKTLTFESVGSTAYPEPPERLEHETVVDFLKEHEAAFRRNELVENYGEDLIHFAIDFDEVYSPQNRGNIQRFALSYDEVFETVDLAGHGPVNVAYAIDESGLVRLDRVTTQALDDTNIWEEGELVTCF